MLGFSRPPRFETPLPTRLAVLVGLAVWWAACCPPVMYAQSVPTDAPCYVDHRLTRADLDGRSLRMLTLMRNAPFARAGYEFETAWIAEHFQRHEWYEPGTFDPDSISARDDHNATLIRQYEETLSLKELRARRRAHWEQKGGVPTEGWRPSVWKDPEAQREALLLSEAIAKRSGSLRAGIPWGFGDDFRLGTPVEALPEAIEHTIPAGTGLGEDPKRVRLPRDSASRIEDSVPDSVLADWGPSVVIYLDSTGRVEQLVVEVDISAELPDEGYVPPDGFAGLHRRVQGVIDRFGPPTDRGNYRRWGDTGTIEPVRWDAGNHVAEVWPMFGCCLQQDAFLAIHTGAPDRMCGPEDGFREWYNNNFYEALSEKDVDRLADFFRFPFEDWSNAGIPSALERYGRSFESRAEFLKEVPDEHPIAPTDAGLRPWGLWAGAVGPNDAECIPHTGRIVSFSDGEYVFHRVNGDWKATGIE